MAKIYATGKRKTAIAKVWLTPGAGKLSINNTNLNDWLGGHEAIKMKVMQPLLLTKREKERGYCSIYARQWLFCASRSIATRNF